jgi:hypothetical protein
MSFMIGEAMEYGPYPAPTNAGWLMINWSTINPRELIQISFQRKKEKQKESKKALPSVQTQS